jgi:hypothetical protein
VRGVVRKPSPPRRGGGFFAAVLSALPFREAKKIVPIRNAPRPVNPVAAVALSILVAFAAGLVIAIGMIWTFS